MSFHGIKQLHRLRVGLCPVASTIWNNVQIDEIFHLTRATFSVYISPQCARSKVVWGVRVKSVPFHIAYVFGASARAIPWDLRRSADDLSQLFRGHA